MITIPGKIPVSIHPLFWLVAFFIGWMWTATLIGAFVAVGIILVSVIFHEFGHALTAVAFGQKTRIELAAFGGFTYREGRKLKLWEEFLVVLNGPVAGVLIALVAFLIIKYVPISNPTLAFALQFAFIANLFWTAINLVPVLPLDGGHLLSIVLEGIFGFRGIKMAIIAGLVIAVSISIFFFVFGQFLIGALFLILTFESFRSLRYYKMFTAKDRDSDLQELLKSADADYQRGDSASAVAKLQDVRDQTKEGILYTMATQQMAAIYKEQERYDEAYQLLVPIRKTLSGNHLALFHFLAYMNGDYETIAKVGNRCYQANPSYNTALINALAYGALRKTKPAVGWLECAVREGLPSLDDAMTREEFDPIREDPDFKKLHPSSSQ